MSATLQSPEAVLSEGPARPEMQRLSLLESSLVVVRRNLIHIKRMPEMLLDVTIQPVMFVLMFAYVFGGSIAVAGSNYREFLVPGIMVQTIAFSSFIVAIGLTTDLKNGIVDRMKSLPIHRASILVGRSVSSLIHSSIGITVMALTGLVIGWRIHNGVWDAVLAFALMLAFGFAMIWAGILVGSTMRSIEAVQGLMFTTIFPLTFVSNAFAPSEDMPAVLRFVAEWNPVSALVQATRDLWGNGLPAPADAAWPLQHAVPVTLFWCVLLTVVFAPLAVRSFRLRSRD